MRKPHGFGIDSCLASDSRYQRARGFSLVELMVVLVILAVFIAIAAPGYSTLSQRTKLKSYVNEFVSSVRLARGEAIKRNTDIKLCTSTAGISCDGGGNWENGWAVLDPNSVVLSYASGLASGYEFGDPDEPTFAEIVFKPSGVANTPAELKLCQNLPEDGVETKRIIVSTTGRTRVVTTPGEACP